MLHHLLVIASSCTGATEKRMWLLYLRLELFFSQRNPVPLHPRSDYICPLICTFKADFSFVKLQPFLGARGGFLPPLWDQTVRLFVASSYCTNLSWLLASRATKEPLSFQYYARMAICLTTQQLIQLYNSVAGLTEATYTVSFHAVRYKSFPRRQRNSNFAKVLCLHLCFRILT